MEQEKPKVVHFSEEFSISEIMDYLKDKEDILYFTRTLKEGKEFHIVKHNDKAFFKMNVLQCEMIKYYSKNESIKPHLKDVKVKGNFNFSVVENVNTQIINKFKNDLNIILKK